MELHLIRHAAAEARRDGLRDEDRALTARGWRQARRLARALHRLGLGYDLMLVSPKRRALETAEPLAGLADRRALEPRLAEPPGEGLLERLLELEASPNGRKARVALVGHQPFLGEAVALMLAREGEGPAFSIAKGGLCALGWPERPALRLLLTPKLIRRVC